MLEEEDRDVKAGAQAALQVRCVGAGRHGWDLPEHGTHATNSVTVSQMEEKSYQGLAGFVRHNLDFVYRSKTCVLNHMTMSRSQIAVF